MRRLGDVEAIRLGDVIPIVHPELQDVHIHVVHKGPLEHRKFGFKVQRARFDEIKRLVKLREGLTPELAPMLFDESKMFVTEEGVTAFAEIAAEVIRSYVVGVTGLPTVPTEAELSIKQAELVRLELAELLLPVVLEVQGLSKAETFPATGNSDVG